MRSESIWFTFGPDFAGPVPLPFEVAGRTVLLVESIPARVLILGYGLGVMGSVMLRTRPGECSIVGVEPASRLFQRAQQTRAPEVELVKDDALGFLSRTRRRFDLVIDDCYRLKAGDAVRPPLDQIERRVRARLRPGGFYVRNTLAGPEGLEAELEETRRCFRHCRLRRFRDWENVLAVASDESIDERNWQRLRPTRKGR